MNRVLLLAPLLAGCLHSSTVLDRTPRVTAKEVVPVPLPDAPSYVAAAHLSGGDVIINVSRISRCRDEVVETVSVTERYENRLMPGHWALLGSGVLLGGAGATGAVMGNSLAGRRAETPLGDAQLESDVDTGRVMFPVGIAVAAVGVALLGIELANVVSLGGAKERTLPPTTTRTPGDDYECGKTPAAQIAVTLSDGSSSTKVTTDANGRAVVSQALLERTFRERWARRDASTTPTLKVLVDRAPETSVSGDLAGLHEAWRSTRDAELASEAKAREAELNEVRRDAKRFLAAKEWEKAGIHALRCLELSPGDAECSSIKQTTDKAILPKVRKAWVQLLEERMGKYGFDVRLWAEGSRLIATSDQCSSGRFLDRVTEVWDAERKNLLDLGLVRIECYDPNTKRSFLWSVR